MSKKCNLRAPSTIEARERGRKGGITSGEARRRKANFRRTLNGDVKAYNTIRDTIGQTKKSDLDIKEQEAKIEHLKAQADN